MIHYIEESRIPEEMIKNSQKLSMIDFFADWCVPCQMLTPVLVELDKKYPEVEFYKVNIEEGKEAMMTYKITSVPTMIFFKDGREVERVVGLESIQDLSEIIESFTEKN